MATESQYIKQPPVEESTEDSLSRDSSASQTSAERAAELDETFRQAQRDGTLAE